MRRAARVVPVLGVVMLAGAAWGQPAEAPAAAPQPEAAQVQVEPLSKVFAARLAALSPARPQEYYLLGEEIADGAVLAEDRRLATELFVHALHLDVRLTGGSSTGASACLALAGLSHSDRDRRWLVFLSRVLDPRRVAPEWLARQAPATDESPVYQVATVVGLVRSGDGVMARQMLEKPGVREALEGYDRTLVNLGTGGASRVIREAQRWPCTQCNNERVTKRGSPPEHRLCAVCKGDPGPELSEIEFVGQLRFEALLLQGSHRSWAAQIASDGGAPLMDTDPSGVARVFHVDPTTTMWRDGRWAVDPSAPKPAPPPPPPKPVDPSAPKVLEAVPTTIK